MVDRVGVVNDERRDHLAWPTQDGQLREFGPAPGRRAPELVAPLIRDGQFWREINNRLHSGFEKLVRAKKS